MAKFAAKPNCLRRACMTSASFSSKCKTSTTTINSYNQLLLFSRVRASSHSLDDKNEVYKQLGLFSLKKKIEDAVLRAETSAPAALELEEAKRVKQEEIIRDYDLWDDPDKSDEILNKLADSAKLVDALKDLKYKAEEAKLISQLAEKDAIDFGLFKEAYDASLDVCKFLDKYETSKLLKGPYDLEGACVTIIAGPKGIYSEIWAEQILCMYIKWAKKQGYEARVVEKCPSTNGGIKSAILELEFKFAYGYLSGEKGVHHMIRYSENGSIPDETNSAAVDVIPLLLERAHDLHIDDGDLMILSPSNHEENESLTESTVRIQHIPTGITVQSSGERSRFANEIKAVNRLKAKLVVVAREQGVRSISEIKSDEVVEEWEKESRRYVFHPYKIVEDVKTGIQLPDLNSVLDGNIDSLIGASVNIRHSFDDNII